MLLPTSPDTKMKRWLVVSLLILAIGVALQVYDHYTTFVIYQGVKDYNVPFSMHGDAGLFGWLLSWIGGIATFFIAVRFLLKMRKTNG